MADGEITLADVLAQIQVLIVNSEQVNKRLSAIEEHLAGVETEEPPVPETDPWALALAQTEEPAGLDRPLTQFSRVDAIEYAVWRRSPLNGTRVGSEETHARNLAVVRDIYQATTTDEIQDPTARKYFKLASTAGANLDVILWAPLVGLVDLFPTGFQHLDETAIQALAGTNKSDGFRQLTFEDAFYRLFPRQGGTPSGNEG